MRVKSVLSSYSELIKYDRINDNYTIYQITESLLSFQYTYDSGSIIWYTLTSTKYCYFTLLISINDLSGLSYTEVQNSEFDKDSTLQYSDHYLTYQTSSISFISLTINKSDLNLSFACDQIQTLPNSSSPKRRLTSANSTVLDPSQSSSTVLDPSQSNSTVLDPSQLNSTDLDPSQLNSTVVDPSQSNWTNQTHTNPVSWIQSNSTPSIAPRVPRLKPNSAEVAQGENKLHDRFILTTIDYVYIAASITAIVVFAIFILIIGWIWYIKRTRRHTRVIAIANDSTHQTSIEGPHVT